MAAPVLLSRPQIAAMDLHLLVEAANDLVEWIDHQHVRPAAALDVWDAMVQEVARRRSDTWMMNRCSPPVNW